MSFRSQHLDCKFSHGAEHHQTEWTVKRLREATWEELLVENHHACGNTRFDPDAPVLAFLKCNMILRDAAGLLGYKGGSRGKNLKERVERRDINNILNHLILLMKAGKMPKKCTDLLAPRTGKGWRISTITIEVAHEIIRRSIKKFGGKKKSCAKLGITLKTMNYWLKWEIVKQA